jgi:hypothetical protein
VNKYSERLKTARRDVCDAAYDHSRHSYTAYVAALYSAAAYNATYAASYATIAAACAVKADDKELESQIEKVLEVLNE